MRVKVLTKGGHTDVDLVELTEAMTKEAATLYLVSMNFANGRAHVQEALEAELTKRADTAPAEKVTAKTAKVAKPAKTAKSKPITLDTIKAKAAPQATKSKAQIEAELANLENAPY
jgi:hypothetical protein